MAFTKAQLQAEITNDPKGLGYAALKASNSYVALAAKLNATYGGVATVFRNDLQAREILGCLVASEVLAPAAKALTATQWTAFSTFLIPGTIDASNGNISALFLALFTNADYPLTRAALIAIGKRVAPTRAEELWGYGTAVSEQDVANAITT